MALPAKKWQVSLPTRPRSVQAFGDLMLLIYTSGLMEVRSLVDGDVTAQGVHPWAISGTGPMPAVARVGAGRAVLFVGGTHSVMTVTGTALTFTAPAPYASQWEQLTMADDRTIRGTGRPWRVDAAGREGGGMVLHTGNRGDGDSPGAMATPFTVNTAGTVQFGTPSMAIDYHPVNPGRFDTDAYHEVRTSPLFSQNTVLFQPVGFGSDITYGGSTNGLPKESLWFDMDVTGTFIFGTGQDLRSQEYLFEVIVTSRDGSSRKVVVNYTPDVVDSTNYSRTFNGQSTTVHLSHGFAPATVTFTDVSYFTESPPDQQLLYTLVMRSGQMLQTGGDFGPYGTQYTLEADFTTDRPELVYVDTVRKSDGAFVQRRETLGPFSYNMPPLNMNYRYGRHRLDLSDELAGLTNIETLTPVDYGGRYGVAWLPLGHPDPDVSPRDWIAVQNTLQHVGNDPGTGKPAYRSHDHYFVEGEPLPPAAGEFVLIDDDLQSYSERRGESHRIQYDNRGWTGERFPQYASTTGSATLEQPYGPLAISGFPPPPISD